MSKRIIKKAKEYFANNREASKIFKNFSWLLSDKILRYGVGFFVGIWIANYFTAAEFGQYSAALAYMFIFSAIATLGLKGIVVKELVVQKDGKGPVLATTMLLILVGGVIAFSMAVGTSLVLNPDDISYQWLVAIVSFSLLLQVGQVFNYYFTSTVQSKYIAIATNVAFCVSSCLKIYGVYSLKSVEYFAWILSVDVLVSGVLLFTFFVKRPEKISHWVVSRGVAKNLLRESLPLILSGIMVAIYMKVDQIMLKNIVGDAETGIYSVAVKLTEIWYFIPVILQSSVFPNLTITDGTDKKAYEEKLFRLFSIVSVFAYAVIIGTLLFGELGVSLLFKPEYQEAIPILYVSIFALLFVGLGVIRSSYLILGNLTKYSFYFTALGAIINVLLNLLLIPKFGGMGAAIATIISYGVSAYFSTFLVKELRPLALLMTKAMVKPRISL